MATAHCTLITDTRPAPPAPFSRPALKRSRALEPKVAKQYLRRRGLVGPVDQEFVDDIIWSNFVVAADKAIKETNAYGPSGAQAYVDDLLNLSIEAARELQAGHPFRIVSERALDLAAERFAA